MHSQEKERAAAAAAAAAACPTQNTGRERFPVVCGVVVLPSGYCAYGRLAAVRINTHTRRQDNTSNVFSYSVPLGIAYRTLIYHSAWMATQRAAIYLFKR